MKKNGMKALRFTHLYLENWKNFTNVDIDLQGRVFLVGPNASGKSNFLDTFRFLHDITPRGVGLQDAVNKKRGGLTKIRCLAARRHPDVVVRVNVGNGEDAQVWQYEIALAEDAGKRLVIKRECVRHRGRDVVVRPNKEDNDDMERLTQTYLQQVNMNSQFRELVDFFSSVQYLHVVPQLVREPDRSIGIQNDPFGGDFLEQIALASEKRAKSRLKNILTLIRVAVPQLEKLELKRDKKRGVPHLHGKYVHWRPQGAWQTEEQFSDGTLRLIGLLWSCLTKGGPLLLEEPELSLHTEVVRYLPQLFGRMNARTGRQIMVSTHSAEMLGDEGLGLDEVLMLLPDASEPALA